MAFTYEYRCGGCGEIAQVEAEAAACPACKLPMERMRIIWNGAVQANNFEPYFNHGLGCWVRNKGDVKEKIRKLAGEDGINVEEVGMENPSNHIEQRTVEKAIDETAFEWSSSESGE